MPDLCYIGSEKNRWAVLQREHGTWKIKCLPCQEEVLKIRSAMGKLTKGTLTMIAFHLENNEWYKELTFRYCRELPLLKQWAQPVADYTKQLLTMALDDEGALVVIELGKKMHQIKESLRPPLIKELEELMVRQCLALCQACLDGKVESVDAFQLVKDVQPTLQELSILYPLNDHIASMIAAVAEYMQTKQGLSEADKFYKNASHILEESSQEQSADLLEVWLEMHGQCSSLGAATFQQAKAAKDVEMSAVWDALLTWLSVYALKEPSDCSAEGLAGLVVACTKSCVSAWHPWCSFARSIWP